MSCDRMGAVPPTYKAHKARGGVVALVLASVCSFPAIVAIEKNKNRRR